MPSTPIAFPVRSSAVTPRARLICLPFAGGSAAAFASWAAAAPGWLDLRAYEPPGRGTRLGGPVVSTLEALLADLRGGLEDLPDLPLALYGHSMGGRVAWSAVDRLGRRPLHLFVGASRPPWTGERPRASLPRAALIDELRRMGATPREVLEDDELIDLFLPVVRADFAVFEAPFPRRVTDVPTTVFAGARDEEVPLELAERWRDACATCSVVTLDDSHFFLRTSRDRVLGQIVEQLEASLERRRGG